MDKNIAENTMDHIPPKQPTPEKILFAWKAAARPFKKRSREFYSTVGVITLLLSVILFIAREFLLIGVILSLAFIGYALSSVPPEKIKYAISNKGIRMGTAFYSLDMLGRFWHEDKWGQKVLMVEHFGGLPSVIMMVVSEKDVKKTTEILSDYLVKQKPEPTPVDKMANWLQEKVPLESE